jgi:hypothetical protein
MDHFTRLNYTKGKYRVGPGGRRCNCCYEPPSAYKTIRRYLRRLLKLQDAKEFQKDDHGHED